MAFQKKLHPRPPPGIRASPELLHFAPFIASPPIFPVLLRRASRSTPFWPLPICCEPALVLSFPPQPTSVLVPSPAFSSRPITRISISLRPCTSETNSKVCWHGIFSTP